MSTRAEILEVLARNKERLSKAIDSILSIPAKLDSLIEAVKNLSVKIEFIEEIIGVPPKKPIPPRPTPPSISPPITRPKVTVPEVFVKQPVTRIWTRENLTLTGYYEVANIEGTGFIREVVVLGLSPDYQVVITIDGRRETYDFNKLTIMQKYVEFLDAIVTTDGYYLFKLYGVHFNNKFTLALQSDKPIQYKYIFVVYDIYT